MKEGWEIDENNFYNEVYEDEEEESDECKKHRLSIEDGDQVDGVNVICMKNNTKSNQFFIEKICIQYHHFLK